MENKVIVIDGDSQKPMDFVEDQFYYARKKVVTYSLAEARNLMRISRYFRKKYKMSPVSYAVMHLI